MLGCPGGVGIAVAEHSGVVPIGLGDMVGVSFAVDGYKVTEGWIVDLYVGATTESGDAELGGKCITEFGVSHVFGVCCMLFGFRGR